jgi:hypothetical protein
MDLTRDQRNELSELSKLVLGGPSRWQKLLNRGYAETVTEEKEETIPGHTKEDGTEVPAKTRTVKVPKLSKGMVVKQVKHHTYETLLKLLQDMKKEYLERKAAWEKVQAMAKLQQEIQQKATGSAV